ncbi:MAG TPA: hypothetical protein PLB38_01640 [bacterium]|nr:hypothetical protein [bacterium]
MAKPTKLILISSFVMIFFLCLNSQTFAITASELPIKIHLGKFPYKDPSPVVRNTSKDAGSNYDPNFSLKDPAKKEAWEYTEGCDGSGCQTAAVKTIEQGEAIVFPRIQGLTIIKLSYLKLINDNRDKFSTFSTPAIFASFILSAVTDQNIIKDYYVAIPSSYQQFKLLNSGVSSLFTILKTLGLAEESPIDFYAGVSYLKPDSNDTIKNKIVSELQAWMPSFASSIEPSLNNFNATTIQNVKNAFNISADLKAPLFINPTQKKQLDGQLSSVASGACYEIKPTGKQNICTNTVKQNCATGTNTYFLHGISCEQLNNLFAFPEHSASINTETQVYKEQIATAALKEKTIFKPQVSFGGITEGISLPDYMNLMYKYLMSFALVITGFVIVIGGVKYMIGQNDGIPMIKNAFIGVILLSGTYVILKTVNPAAVNMNIIEIGDISRKTTTATDNNTGGTNYSTNNTPISDAQPITTSEIIGGCAAPLNTIISGCVDLENSEERITDPAKMAELAKKFGNDQGLGLYYNNNSQGVSTYAWSIPGDFTKKYQNTDGKTIYENLKESTFPKPSLTVRKDKNGRTSVFQIVNGSNKSEKIGISCIGYIQAYYSCLGRPVYAGGAHSLLVMHGNLIKEINISDDKKSISINGRVLEVGDVIGWVGYERFNNPEDGVAKKAKAAIESIASGGSTIAPISGSRNYSIKINRTVNGKPKVIEHKILGVSHVVLYIGNGEFFDWGAGTLSRLGSLTEKGGAVIHDSDLQYHSYVVFLNQLEKDSYTKFLTNKYGVTSCKQLWNKVKNSETGKYDFYNP